MTARYRHWARIGTILCLFATIVLPSTDLTAKDFPSAGQFALTYTFTTSTPGTPIDVGGGRDLTVNRYLTTIVNDSGAGFLNLIAGRCTNIRFTNREQRTIDSKGYCNFKDDDGDIVYAEYTTGTPKPSKAITLIWSFTSGTGKFAGINGTAEASNSNNIDDTGAYQAAGKMNGSYKILRNVSASDVGLHD